MLDSAFRHFRAISDVRHNIPDVTHSIHNYYLHMPFSPWPRESKSATYYEVGKLAFNLLSISLSRLKALGGSAVQEISILLQNHLSIHLINNDPLELEKVKVAQAIEQFLKV